MTEEPRMPRGMHVRLTKLALKRGVPPPRQGADTIGVVFRTTRDDWRRCVKWPKQQTAHYYAIEYLEEVSE